MADVGQQATQYLSGDDTGGCMETLAKRGVVREELGDEKARMERFKRLVGFARTGEPEPYEEEMARLFPGSDKVSK
jgi:hypothetical protein